MLFIADKIILSHSSESLPDVEILANINFLFNSNQSLFSWEEYGFKLHVPRKSTANFKVRVVKLKTYELPEGTELLSPFYWVTSEGDTAGPVGVEIQHCCGRIAKESLSGMGFAMHKVFNDKSGPSRSFEEVRGQLSNSDGYAVMKVDFSDRIVALFRRLKRSLHLETRYQAKLYYYNEPSVMTTCVAHIVITPDVNACHVANSSVLIIVFILSLVQTFIQEKYGRGYVSGPDDLFYFQKEEIALAIGDGPLDSPKHKNGWDITPMNSMEVR